MSEKEPAPPEDVTKPKETSESPRAEAPPKLASEPKEPTTPSETPERAEGKVVLIGRKPAMNYVVACLTFFNAGEKEVLIKARGRAISKAVDTVELLRRSFVKNLTVKQIKLGTEEMTRQEGRRSNVSTMEITLTKTE